MKTFEILCADRDGYGKRVHVVAENGGEAVMEFRGSYSLDDWRVEWIREVIKPTVIEDDN